MEAFNAMRAGVMADRSQFLRVLSVSFYGANRPGAGVSQAILDAFWLQGMRAGLPGVLASIKAFAESDHTEDLKRIDVPTLILHGEDDQIVPVAASAMVSAVLVKGSTLKVYPGLSNGMYTVNKDQINTDLLDFLKSA
jgi:non-heme chloroperoxidase